MPEQVLPVSGGVELCVESLGEAGDPPIVLVMGLGTQMIWWDLDFCRLLTHAGFRVIRFDNRDCGRSTVMTGRPDLPAIAAGEHSTLAYTLDDLAADTVGLLDALELERAHLVGASMGGMTSQLVALGHPDRVLSLTSIMSTTGARDVGAASPAAVEVLMSPPALTLEEQEASAVRGAEVIGSPGKIDPERIRARAREAFGRGVWPEGTARQLAAILAAPDRTERLSALSVPTLVIHGSADPLIAISGGRATAEAIPGARLHVIEGMGHDLPPALQPEIAEAIVAHARSVSPARDAA